MLKHRALTTTRIEQVGKRLLRAIYTNPVPLAASCFVTPEPVPFSDIGNYRFEPIKTGQSWGDEFECAWFRFEGRLDKSFRGRSVVALIDVGGEGCVFDARGLPIQGLTPRFDDLHGGVIGPKREVRIRTDARGNESVSLLVDAGANHLQGRQRRCEFRQAELCILDQEMFSLYHEYRFLELLMLALPSSSRHAQLLLRCLNDVCNIITTLTQDEVASARERLKVELERPAKDSALKVSAIGHAHLDVAWLWPLRETVRKCARTFSTALMLIRDYPEYHFGASQPHLYQMTKDHYPALYRKIKAAVKAGRWEVQGGMWVESDCNLPSGESLVRQLLYGKRFFRAEFGIDVRHLWLPDVFGYSGALPQILKQSGIDYFTTHKLNWNQFNVFPHHTMNWEGIDGSSVFAHFMTGNDYNVPATPRSFMNFESEARDGDRTDHALCLFGIGDGGGGPGRTHIEWTRLAANVEDLPRVTMESAATFFGKAEASSRDLMTWSGELYFEYHRGTYTSQALVKRMNRRLEFLIREVEFLYAQLPSAQYPGQELEAIWKVLLLNQFHDIIPGSSINRVYKEAHEQYCEAERALLKLRDIADANYNDTIAAPAMSDPHIVLNSLSWQRDTLVFLADDNRILWADAEDTPLASQRVDGGVLVAVSVPSMGHNVMQVALGHPVRRRPEQQLTERRLENELLRVEFGPHGELTRIFDKQARREVLAEGATGNVFQLYEDQPLAYEAWDIDAFYLEKPPTSPTLVSTRLVESGPLRAMIEQVWEAPNYAITQKISLRRNDRILEFDTQVDWREDQHMLRVDFPVNIRADRAHFEIQFGHVARPTHMNTSWDMARFESVAHRWADLSQPNYGVALLNDCKYGHRIHGNTLSLNLLRSPRSPDPEADRHLHTFRYALYPHPGNHVDAEVVNRAYEFNVPARVFRAVAKSGSRPPRDSFITCSSPNVIIDTVKKAEDSDHVVVRLYESYGIDCNVTLGFSGDISSACGVNLMEEEPSPLALSGRTLTIPFAPFQIRTIRLTRQTARLRPSR